MLPRPAFLDRLAQAAQRSPITALLGPRQCGKTTLARTFAEGRQATFFDLESVVDQRRLQNPELALGSLSGLVILDEIQVLPELFPVLRVLADRPGGQVRFLILGSASPHVIRHASETLAGRVAFIELSGFDLTETGPLSSGSAFHNRPCAGSGPCLPTVTARPGTHRNWDAPWGCPTRPCAATWTCSPAPT